jgi:hypothetical protein
VPSARRYGAGDIGEPLLSSSQKTLIVSSPSQRAVSAIAR